MRCIRVYAGWIREKILERVIFNHQHSIWILDLLHLGGAHLAVGAGRWVRGKNLQLHPYQSMGDGGLMMDEFARSKEGRWM
jgi:hypothetical protein